ncbi:hypothetical protein AV530_006536 [Patagioenas fasciata monilis]|uniref:Uncharacterized protein n=1 Tax=Patagioenas fasciata monilis TaxID=372326 RepID=A0A1V4KGR8_PATFA|nr:hypothetical protein AV530_006536 [Patagioenas fasciata monilis]
MGFWGLRAVEPQASFSLVVFSSGTQHELWLSACICPQSKTGKCPASKLSQAPQVLSGPVPAGTASP